MNPCFRTIVALVAVMLAVSSSDTGAETSGWQRLEPGLELGLFTSSKPAGKDGFPVTVVRIDPAFFNFRLLAASEHGKTRRTVEQWCGEFSLVCAVNAGMYQADGLSHVSLMKNFSHVNNPRVSKDNAVLAFNPADDSVPAIQIIDRKCQNFDSLKSHYRTLIQNIRMVSCSGKNVWARQPEKWSIAALGMDREGRVLFLFSRSPVTVHDFIETLLTLPFSLYNAMYLEGGAPASLYLSSGKTELKLSGTPEGGLFSVPLPNVIGISRKTNKVGHE